MAVDHIAASPWKTPPRSVCNYGTIVAHGNPRRSRELAVFGARAHDETDRTAAGKSRVRQGGDGKEETSLPLLKDRDHKRPPTHPDSQHHINRRRGSRSEANIPPATPRGVSPGTQFQRTGFANSPGKKQPSRSLNLKGSKGGEGNGTRSRDLQLKSGAKRTASTSPDSPKRVTNSNERYLKHAYHI